MPHPFDYVSPNEKSVEKIKSFRASCKELHEAILAEIPACRERSVALTSLEEVSMWGNKAIVFTQEVQADVPLMPQRQPHQR